MKSAIETIKPISCALLVSVAINLIHSQIQDIKAIILLFVFLLISWKSKKDPIFYILFAGTAGVIIVALGKF